MNWHLTLSLLLIHSLALGHAGGDYREEDASEEMEYGTLMHIIPAPSPTVLGNRVGNGGYSKTVKIASAAAIGKSSKKNYSQATSVKSAKDSASVKGTSVKSVKTTSIKSTKRTSVKGYKTTSVQSSKNASVKGYKTASVKSAKNVSVKGSKSTSTKSTKNASFKVSKKSSIQGKSPKISAVGTVNSGYAIKDSTTGGKNAKSSSSFLKSSGKSKPGNDSSEVDGKGSSGSDAETSEAEGNHVQDTMVSTLTFPKFMLTMTNAPDARFLRLNYDRNLGTYLDLSIIKTVRAYLSEEGGVFEKAVGASIQMLSLDIAPESIIVKNGDTKTFISTFSGTASFTGEKDVTVIDIQSALRVAFEEKKKNFLKEAKNSDNPNVASITDVIFSFVLEDEYTNSGGNGYSTDLEGSDSNGLQSKALKSKSTIPMIAGMAVAVSVMIAAFVYTKRKRRDRSGYKLSEEYDTDLESVPTVPKLMLSDLAAGSVQNSTGYASLITGVWASKKCSMSELAAGATQEDFARHGLPVETYGKPGGNKKEKNKKKQSPNSKVKGTLLATNLDPIEEVRSATGSESWQEGDEQITNAPPLLPSLSVSNSSGSEADDQDASFRTPRISDMTEYAEMSSIDGSPVFNESSSSTPMRHLNFSSESYTDDDSVQEAMCPFQNEKSVDNGPNEKCLAEEKDIEVVPLGFEESAEEEENVADAILPIKNNDFVTPNLESVSKSGSEDVEQVALNTSTAVIDEELDKTYASGKEVKEAVFGSDPLELTKMISDENSVSLLVSDNESSGSIEEHNIRSSMSVDGQFTDISLSGRN